MCSHAKKRDVFIDDFMFGTENKQRGKSNDFY